MERDLNHEYQQLLDKQIQLRGKVPPTLNVQEIKQILRAHQETFTGDLLFVAANDFGQPAAFVPSTVSSPETTLNSLLSQIHRPAERNGKWGATHTGLRAVREEIFAEVENIHKGLPALAHRDGCIEYDIEEGRKEAYNFVTIRQVIRLVDWCANSYQSGDLIRRY